MVQQGDWKQTILRDGCNRILKVEQMVAIYACGPQFILKKLPWKSHLKTKKGKEAA